MRRIAWLGVAAAAVLLVAGEVVLLRGGLSGESSGTAATVASTVPASNPPASNPAAANPPAAGVSAPPPAPAASASATARPPSFDVVTVSPQGQAVIAGRAAPGDHVRVLDGDKALGEVTADQRGEWVLVPSAPVPPGDHQVAAEAVAPQGGQVRRSGDTVALAVKTPADTQAPALAVLVPEDTDKPAQVISPSGAGAPGGTLELDTARAGSAARLALSGRAAPGARLNIYAGEQLLGTATADLNGRWTLTAPGGQLPPGFELRLDQLAEDGRVIRRVTEPFTPPPVASSAHPAHDYIVRRGNNLWLIARHVYGDGVRFTAIYTANRGQIRDPDMIYPGQHFHLPRS